MELDQALNNLLSYLPAFPREEITCIRQNKEEAIPKMLEFLQNFVKRETPFPKDYKDFSDPIFYMFLLAEFRVHEAFEPFIEILKFSEYDYDYFIGDKGEDLASMIASVATEDDIPKLKENIENTELPDIQRRKGLQILLILYVQEMYEREDFFAYLNYLLEKILSDTDKLENEEMITYLVFYCMLVCNDLRLDLFEKAVDDGRVDPFFMHYDDFYGIAKTPDEAFAQLKGKFPEERVRFINDTVRETEWWHCFKNGNSSKFSTTGERKGQLGFFLTAQS